jgi:sodium-dependent dicarboxylate transporter 2/3/5
LHLAAGPLAFAAIALLPAALTYPIRCSLGLLVWMAWWWIARPVHLAVTGLLPLVVPALFNFVPLGQVLPAYADELIILLVGANILSVAWQRWGLDKRIALASLLGAGTSAMRQVLVWYSVSALLATLLPRSVVAAALIPIVIAMLRYIGITDLWNSPFATALVLAIAWGASVGGFLTPMGGAPNLLAMKFVEDTVTHHEFLFVTWVTRLLPLSIATIVCLLVYMRFAFKPEMREAPGSRDFFIAERKALGPMSAAEKWSLALFTAATALAFARQLYSSTLPALTPAFAFLLFGILCFVVRSKGAQLLTWEFAQSQMMWGLFYVFAGGTALGAILNNTGTAAYLAGLLLPYAGDGGLTAMVVLCGLTMVIAQVVSNVATVAITTPIAISVFADRGINPMPFVYAMIAAGHCGFMLPSSAGSSAIAAGYGVNLKTMFLKGFWAAVLALVVIVAVAYVSLLVWPGFGEA